MADPPVLDRKADPYRARDTPSYTITPSRLRTTPRGARDGPYHARDTPSYTITPRELRTTSRVLGMAPSILGVHPRMVGTRFSIRPKGLPFEGGCTPSQMGRRGRKQEGQGQARVGTDQDWV